MHLTISSNQEVYLSPDFFGPVEQQSHLEFLANQQSALILSPLWGFVE